MKFKQAIKLGAEAVRRPTWPASDKLIIADDRIICRFGGRTSVAPRGYWNGDIGTDWVITNAADPIRSEAFR